MRHWRDEAEASAGLLDCHVACRAAGAVSILREGELFSEAGAHFRQRQVAVGAIFLDFAHRHGLDEGQVHAAAMGPAHQLGDFAVIEVVEGDRVDLDLEARGLRGVDALHDL